MPTFDIELMTQFNQLFEPPTSSFRGDECSFERCSTCLGQSEASTPDRHMNESPCSSSSGTLVSEEDFQAHKLMDVQLIQPPIPGSDKAQETVSDTRSTHIFSPQPRKSEFNPNAAPFVPSHSTILRLASSSPAPTLVDVKQTWQELLPLGSSTTEPSRRRHFARALAVSNPWTFDTLCELAQHFCWISADYEHTGACPGSTALFAQDVRDAVTSTDTAWEPSCFTFQLKKYALEHFKSYWSSLHNPNAISSDSKPDNTQCKSAFNLSCFIADMFALRLIDAPTMHECLGILLREMAGVEHVFTIQAVIIRAGARLWQGADSHCLFREFTTCFLERSSSLPDDASITGLETSIQEVIQAGNINRMINEWHAQRSEYPSPVIKSIWA
ncbi:hypothetical protein AZE42_04957 [Rhizopogon vesiculosus]|uniref:Uncharacterized protein n=1 Tax=Rhizopogon vesiculosus TaxID=180088 RepID=A0A1J8Q323_9AGAM|nr:hypothetical protein AZE42_04957 [Rhizopogon vesiculosus]